MPRPTRATQVSPLRTWFAMSFDQALQDLSRELYRLAPAFALVFFRVAGMFVFAPLLGSGKIPRRVKVLLGLCKGKQQHDKRQTAREQDAKREIAREMGRRR